MNSKYEKLLADYDKHCKRIERATTININEKPAERFERIAKIEKDYATWFEYYFTNYAKSKCSRYQKRAAWLLINFQIIYLLFEVFRSGGKSVHINMGIPLYVMLVKKDLWYMLLIGQTERKAQRLLSGIQAQLKHNQRIINDYGRLFNYGDWSEGEFLTTTGVRFKSFGFGQSPRGEQEEGLRPDYISVDDTDTKKHLGNDRIMQEYEDFIFEDLIGCFDASPTARRRFVFANNNFHKKSLTNRIKIRFKLSIEKAKQQKLQPVHYILHVPAVKDLVKFEPNWPEKTTAAFWKALYDEVGHRSFCREYMHIHIDVGKIFKAETLQWKQALKLHKYDGLVCYGDLSYKNQGDYKAMIMVGKSGREFHIIHCYLRKTSRTEVAEWLYDLWIDKKLSSVNIKIKIEGLFAQDEFISDFDNEGEIRGFYIPVTADNRGKANKHDRIESIEPYFHRRWVFFNEAEKGHVDQEELKDQLLDFEKGSDSHDDGPDALHGAMDELNRMTFVDKFEPRITKRNYANTRF